MNLLKQFSIVERLLNTKSISAKEAVILLSEQKIEMSVALSSGDNLAIGNSTIQEVSR